MSEKCTLLAVHGLPTVVAQALDDKSLSPTERLTMWELRLRLDLVEFSAVYAESLAKSMRVDERTAGKALSRLTALGYLVEDPHARRPRAYRFPWSRRVMKRAA